MKKIQPHPIIRLLRIKHWVKNLFVFAPILFANKFTELSLFSQASLAFISFCLISSCVYIINDIADIKNDKKHPIKSIERPLASEELTKKQAMLIFCFLLALTASALYFLPSVTFVLSIYLATNILYSTYLKHQPVIDIFTIAFGFLLRVYVGAVAIQVDVSNWMFITILCLALFLAAIKRSSELKRNGAESRKVLKLYSKELTLKYAEMSSSATLVFYSLYVISEKPELVISIPVVIFGIYRYWFIAFNTNKAESPADVLLEDRLLQLTIIVWLSVVVYAHLGI